MSVGSVQPFSLNHNQLFEAHLDATHQLSASRLNNHVHIQASQGLRPGRGYRLTQTPGGTTMNIIARRGGGAAPTAYVPWKPTFFTEGTGESIVYKCRFNLGTVNQNVAGNWNDAFTLSMAENDFHFVVITMTTASGKVTGVTISVDSSPPTEDSIAKDTPPVSFKVVLGAIGRTEAKMIIDRNLEAVGTEVFRESEAAPATGAEPFHRWWRWNVEAL